MTFSRLRRLCLKELRESLRDRRTMATLILMPLIVYPLLSLAFQRFVFTSDLSSLQPEIILAVPDSRVQDHISEILIEGTRQLEQQPERLAVSPPQFWDSSNSRTQRPRVLFRVTPDVEACLEDGSADLIVRPLQTIGIHSPGSENSIADQPRWQKWQLVARDNSFTSQRALDFVTRRIAAVNQEVFRQRLRQLGGSDDQEIDTEIAILKQPGQEGGSLGIVIPLVLILMTMAGAVYPAIDCTAGERERGTLEALIATPVPRFALLLAKYVAVVVVSALTATANLTAMSATLLATGLSRVFLRTDGVPWTVLGQTFLLLVIFACFFSALVLTVASFARSFKEAQAYLVPLILVSLGPSLISLMPGLTMTPTLAVTPLMNLVLLARDIFDGQDLSLAFLVVISTLLYSLAAVGLAARVFGSDAVLYGSEWSWTDLIARPHEKQTEISSHFALALLAVLLPLFILGASGAAQVWGQSLRPLLVANSVLMILLFGVLPITVLWFRRVQLVRVYRLARTSAVGYFGAALIGISLWWVVLTLLHPLVRQATAWDRFQLGRELVLSFHSLSWGWLLVGLAIVPAVLEEIFFRGLLLSAFLKDTSPNKAIWASAFLFGLFHVVSGTLAAERFLPTMVVGLFLGWICWKTGSTLPGMLAHALHNSLLLIIARWQPEWERAGWTTLTGGQILIGFVAALSLLILGVWIVHRVGSSMRKESELQSATDGAKVP